MKRCSTPHVIKEIKIKQDIATHLLEWPKSGILATVNAGKDV